VGQLKEEDISALSFLNLFSLGETPAGIRYFPVFDCRGVPDYPDEVLGGQPSRE
jgi:hypothetical protein